MSEDTTNSQLTNSQLYGIVRQYFQTAASMDHVQQERIKLVQSLLERIPAERADDFIFSYAEGNAVEMRIEGLEATLYMTATKDRRGSVALQLYLESNANKARDDLACAAARDGKGTRKWARTTLEKMCKALLPDYAAV
ncbi:hypothetical protein HY642_04395 [Candidatus Woesearchaeota archaeon]|nr:hypothetical protein [Candidatus Woesearchaeota archaeon]